MLRELDFFIGRTNKVIFSLFSPSFICSYSLNRPVTKIIESRGKLKTYGYVLR